MGTNGSLTRARMLIGSVVSGKLPPLLDRVQYFFLSSIALAASFVMLILASW